MADYDNRLVRGAAGSVDALDAGLRTYMLRVYNYMLVGLGLTGAVAWLVSSQPSLQQIFYNQVATPQGMALQPNLLGWIAIFAPLGMVLLLSFRIQKMSFAAAQMTFWAYAAVMGISLSTILYVYTGASIAMTFFVTAGTFGAMSLYGYTTKRDLSGFGSFLIMGVFGLVIAGLVNIFLQSTMMQFVISVITVLVFVGLTAYDTQRIKSEFNESDASEITGKQAIFGAASLYMNFVNIFLALLNLFGNNRN